jgi:hypothetical protein
MIMKQRSPIALIYAVTAWLAACGDGDDVPQLPNRDSGMMDAGHWDAGPLDARVAEAGARDANE